MVRRIRLRLQYDGSEYNGWQSQPTGATIQGVLQDRIFKITGERVKVAGAGRTDAGVHAIEQVAAFDMRGGLPAGAIKKALNALLPLDIRITDADETDPAFNPRYGARSKRYSYLLANMSDVPVFIHKYAWHVRVHLSMDCMNAASECLTGFHDFSSFRGAGCGAKKPFRTIYRVEIKDTAEADFLFVKFSGRFIRISIEADAFLRHMARNIVGTLVEIGRGRMQPEGMKEILRLRNRRFAGPTAPACGLFLEKISYPSFK